VKQYLRETTKWGICSHSPEQKKKLTDRIKGRSFKNAEKTQTHKLYELKVIAKREVTKATNYAPQENWIELAQSRLPFPERALGGEKSARKKREGKWKIEWTNRNQNQRKKEV